MSRHHNAPPNGGRPAGRRFGSRGGVTIGDSSGGIMKRVLLLASGAAFLVMLAIASGLFSGCRADRNDIKQSQIVWSCAPAQFLKVGPAELWWTFANSDPSSGLLSFC